MRKIYKPLIEGGALATRECFLLDEIIDELYDIHVLKFVDLVGGYSAKLRFPEKLRGHLPRSYDVDFAGIHPPYKLFPKDRIINSKLIEKGYMSHWGIKEIFSPFPVYKYHLKSQLSFNGISVDSIDYFHPTVGPIPYQNRDHYLREKCRRKDGIEFFNAHIGFSLATLLNPLACTPIRARYASCLIAFGNEFDKYLPELIRLLEAGGKISKKFGVFNEYKNFTKPLKIIKNEKKKIDRLIALSEKVRGEKIEKRYEERIECIKRIFSELDEKFTGL